MNTMPNPPSDHNGVHDDCDICDAILTKRASDPDECFIDADEFLGKLDRGEDMSAFLGDDDAFKWF